MRKIKFVQEFDKIWEQANNRNKELGAVYGFDVGSSPRFHRIFSKYNGEKGNTYITMGIYDSESKKHVLFDSINLSGNFRYNSKTLPKEFNEMISLIKEN